MSGRNTSDESQTNEDTGNNTEFSGAEAKPSTGEFSENKHDMKGDEVDDHKESDQKSKTLTESDGDAGTESQNPGLSLDNNETESNPDRDNMEFGHLGLNKEEMKYKQNDDVYCTAEHGQNDVVQQTTEHVQKDVVQHTTENDVNVLVNGKTQDNNSQLEKEKALLSMELEETKRKVEELQGENDNLKKDLDVKISEISQLVDTQRENNEQFRQSLSELEKQLVQSNSGMRMPKENNSQLEKEKALLSIELEETKRKVKELQGENDSLKKDLETQDDYKDLYRRIKPEQDRAEEQIRNLKDVNDTLQLSKEELSGQVVQQESSMSNLNSQNEQMQRTIEDVQSELQLISSENISLKERKEQYEKAMQRLNEKTRIQQSELKNVKENNGWLEQSHWNKEQERTRIEKLNRELTEKLTQYETRIQQQTEGIETLRSNLDAKNEECHKINTDLETHRENENRNQELQNVLFQAQREKERKKDKIVELKAELAAEKADKKEKEAEIAVLTDRLNRHEMKIQECNQNHEEKIERLNQRITECRTAIATKDGIVEELKIDAARMTARMQLLEARNRQELANFIAKQAELQEVYRELNQTKIKLENSQLDIERVSAESNGRHNEIRRLHEELLKAQASLIDFNTRHGNLPQLESNQRRLESIHRIVQSENKQLKERIRSLGACQQTTFHHVQDENRRVSAELQYCQTCCSMMEQKNRDLSNQLHESMETIQHLSSTELSLNRSMLVKHEENDELKRRITEAIGQIDTLGKTLNEKNGQIDTLVKTLNEKNETIARMSGQLFTPGNLGSL